MEAQDLIESLQKRGTSNQHNFTPLKQNALQQLADIFNEATGTQKNTNDTDVTIATDIASTPRVEKIITSVPRVGRKNQPSSSYDATKPDNIRNKTYSHQRKTRQNTTINDTPKATPKPR